MPSKAHCTYYNLPVSTIEDPEFAFTCERANYAGECPPDCPHYSVMAAVRKEAKTHGC